MLTSFVFLVGFLGLICSPGLAVQSLERRKAKLKEAG